MDDDVQGFLTDLMACSLYFRMRPADVMAGIRSGAITDEMLARVPVPETDEEWKQVAEMAKKHPKVNL